MKRGHYTKEFGKKHNITLEELRLMPYLQYCLMNSQSIDPAKISSEERKILSRWQKEGKITRSCISGCSITKEFWTTMNEILYEAYVPKLEKEGDI